ncbi:PorP/SprF family type IX secretion system membrane protein [Vicingaceae bacterium]|nr:PorP/SprF family type IX secretion system membrane protein [Vicingaceae bacterium]
MRKFVSYILLVFLSCNLFGQDIHFSQFNSSFLNLNPALTGSFNGEYRFNGNFRNQWASISEPYQTFSAGIDASRPIIQLPNLKLGIVFINDEAGVGSLKSATVNSNIGYHIKIDRDSTWIIKTGLMLGFSTRTVNFNKFTYDNQYTGRVFDPNLSNGEDFDRNNLTHLNLGIGLELQHRLSSTDKIEIGLSVFNLNNPNLSFANEAANLDIRTSIYVSSKFQLTEKLNLLPSLLWSRQDKYQELVIGSELQYHFEGQSVFSDLYGGFFLRDGDAFIFTTSIDYENWNLGLSYDVNYSELRTASNRRGGAEISLTYIFKKYVPNLRRYKICPNFM